MPCCSWGHEPGPPALGAVVVVVLLTVAVQPFVQAPPPEPSLARLLLIAIDVVHVPAALALGLVVFIDGERLRAKAESDALLLNVLPRSIADRLKSGERVIADHYDEVTILFADVVDFTAMAARETPAQVVVLLNNVFSGFDTLAERYGLEKIKTIGDAYMVAPGTNHRPCRRHARGARDAHGRRIDRPSPGRPLHLRIGVATGPAVAGVIGHRKFSYDLWGDALNLASRIESTTAPTIRSRQPGDCTARRFAAARGRRQGLRYPGVRARSGLGALRRV